MTSTQKKTWIEDLTALVTLSNILIKQVEAKKTHQMFKKNWFQANGHEQEKAFLILLLSETLKHSRCSQEDNEFSSDDHLKFFIVASS